MKELFLDGLREGNDIIEYYLPKDAPHFCTGCKTCFFVSEEKCPHAEYIMPIWNDIMGSEIIVFAYPVYALRAPGQIKALLDHFCVHWMVHRPEKEMFEKRGIIITQSIGAPNGAAQKDVATSLNWLGVSDIKKLGMGLMEGVIWDDLSDKRREKIENKIRNFSRNYNVNKKAGKSLKIRLFFFFCRIMHQKVLKNEDPVGADNQHWIENGWIRK